MTTTREAETESEINAKNLNHPRITPGDVDSRIASEQFHRFPGTTTTVCCLTLVNGYTVIGHSACVSPENFDSDLGRKIARSNARDKIWALEGYLPCQELYMSGI
jgi:hypothetical protein